MDRKIKYASVVAVVATFIALLVAFGVDISVEQQAAILKFLAALGPILAAVTGFFTHASTSDPSRKTAIDPGRR